jgi:hypothetical protein
LSLSFDRLNRKSMHPTVATPKDEYPDEPLML